MTTITASSTVGIGLSSYGSPSYVNPVVINPGVTISNYYAYGIGVDGGGDVWTIRSAGTIAGNITSGQGVDLKYGGSVTNQSGARISGLTGVYGGYELALSVVNAGSITGNTTTSAGNGIYLQAGGSVTNQSGGMITGFDGIYGGANYTLMVVNAGSIAGNTAAGEGIYLGHGGSVFNQSSATINGSIGIGGKGGPMTVVNAGTVSGGISFAPGYVNLLTVNPGAVFNGSVDGGNTIGAGSVSTLELASAASDGTVAGLGTKFTNFGSIVFDAGANWSIAGNISGLAGTISDFAIGDTIELTDVTATGSSFSGGILKLDEAIGSTTLDLPGTFTTASEFHVVPIAGGTEVTVAPPCFCSGTRLLAGSGEVAVEAVAPGDLLVTVSGQARSVQWIGRRHINFLRHPRPQDVQPVRVRAGAFGASIPHRDLLLSPDHSVFIDGVLIPIRYLINGRTIVQEPVERVTYYHVELDQHDVILAEGLPCESYLDTGNRSAFANGGDEAMLHPGKLVETHSTVGDLHMLR